MNYRTLVVLVIGVLVGSAVPVVSAHETETVDGYEMTFGGADEPIITDERMWLEVEIVDAETGEPVKGLEDSLTIAVQRPFGNDTHRLDVSSSYGQPGRYEAPVVFTEPGTYTVFISGTIDGTEANLTFQKQVHDASNLEYPPQSETQDNAAGAVTEGISGIAIGAAFAVFGMAIAFIAGRQL